LSALNRAALVLEVVGYRRMKPGVADIVHRARRNGQVAARQLVRALGAGFDGFQATLDGEVDGLVVAGLEVQAVVIFHAAPVAAIQRVAADEVDRAGDPAAFVAHHDQQDVFRHGFADSRKELAGEVGRAPFAPARVQVETVEVVPVLFGDVAACEPDDLQPGLVHRLAFFPDVLALA
jgi:hypothetical protein